MYDEAEKERLKSNFDLVSYARGYTDLFPKGREMWGISPLNTKETEASFHISACGKKWMDFSTNQGGDCISFIQAVNGCDFNEAYKILGGELSKYTITPQLKAEREKKANEQVEKKPCDPQNYGKLTYVEEYEYNDGELLKVRYSSKDDKKTFRWFFKKENKWYSGRNGIHTRLFTNGKPITSPVFCLEGERDVLKLTKLGFNAVTSPDGADSEAQKWKPEYSQELAGHDVVLIPDEDDDLKGIEYMKKIAERLNLVGCTTRLLYPSEISPKQESGWDISDVIRAYGDEPIKEWLNDYLSRNCNEPMNGIIVKQFGLGEELDELIYKAAKETVEHGDVSLETEVELQTKIYNKRVISKSKLTKKIKEIANDIKREHGILEDKTKNETLSLDGFGSYDITGTGYIRTNDGKIIDAVSGDMLLSQTALCVGRFTNVESNVISMLIMFVTPDGELKELTIPLEVLNSNLEMFKVCSKYGLDIPQTKAAEVVNYFKAQRDAHKEIIKKLKVLERVGWYENYLMPIEKEKADVIISDPQSKNTEKLFYPKGDKELQRQAIIEMLDATDTAKIILGAAVSSLVIGYLEKEIAPSINIWGKSEKGKTMAVRVISSMFGSVDDKKSFWMESNATDTKDQNHSAFLYNYPLIIDDMIKLRGLNAKEPQVIERAIYAIVNGEGRGRVKQDGITAQKVSKWHNTLILTNERQIIDNMSSGGILARLIDVKFEEELTNEFCKRLLDVVTDNYGNFNQDIADEIREMGTYNIEKKINSMYDKVASMGVIGKRGRNVANLAMGYMIGSKVLGYNEKFPIDKIIRDIESCGEVSDGARSYIVFMTWLETAVEQFRYKFDNKTNTLMGKLGHYNEKKAVFITNEKFISICTEKGIAYKTMLEHAYYKELFEPIYNEKGNLDIHKFEVDGHNVNGIIVYFDWKDRHEEKYDWNDYRNKYGD